MHSALSVPNMYRLFVESLGIYQNNDLIKQASGYIQSKIALIRSHIDGVGEFDGSILSKEESSMQDINQKSQEDYIPQYCKFYKDEEFIVFVLFQDDYTIGKLVEKYFYKLNSKKCSFIGFKKEHPTKRKHIFTLSTINQVMKVLCTKTLSLPWIISIKSSKILEETYKFQ